MPCLASPRTGSDNSCELPRDQALGRRSKRLISASASAAAAVGSGRLVGDPLIELLRVRKGRRAFVRSRILASPVRWAGIRVRLMRVHAWRWDRLLRLLHGVLPFDQPPTPCRFSQRSHAAMTIRAIAWRSPGSLTNSGIVNAAAVPSSRTSGTVRRPVSRSNSNEPYDQCFSPGTALIASVTTPRYPAGALRNRRDLRRGPGRLDMKRGATRAPFPSPPELTLGYAGRLTVVSSRRASSSSRSSLSFIPSTLSSRSSSSTLAFSQVSSALSEKHGAELLDECWDTAWLNADMRGWQKRRISGPSPGRDGAPKPHRARRDSSPKLAAGSAALHVPIPGHAQSSLRRTRTRHTGHWSRPSHYPQPVAVRRRRAVPARVQVSDPALDEPVGARNVLGPGRLQPRHLSRAARGTPPARSS